MLTRDQLSKALSSVNVQDFAKLAGVSQKTLYRLRNQDTAPSFKTLAKIVAVLERQKRAAKGAE